eukprot:430986-Amphidinium_carterae.1
MRAKPLKSKVAELCQPCRRVPDLEDERQALTKRPVLKRDFRMQRLPLSLSSTRRNRVRRSRSLQLLFGGRRDLEAPPIPT